ncbi:nitrogenase iron-molybdenum cofactor biosynthesis protein NifE [Clostridium botulinum A2B7 92]|uniref:nitrogenase component 1 n=1 Tax=Clostridium botulinum TaxID=1491 RepID=UPI0007E17E0E|nr:nitrogenase component 1 [Clostridium botulinum]KEJ00111.1 nitrogenase iron-molybdenum cofactor biosynthesis protein NifE [Clostridium botulinum A2B7 92]
MGIHKFKPPMSGRMGVLWTLASIRDAALIEYGCMGHMQYGRMFLNQAGISRGCKLYSTHIDETDISLGDTRRLNSTIAQIVERDKPKIIFLLPSSVPTVIGTDLMAICEELQPEYPDVTLLPFGYGGFDIDGHRGVQEALLLLAKTLPKDVEKTEEPTFNIIGSCADLFRFHADAEEIIRIMKGAFGIKKLCVMTSDTSVEQIENMGGAHINLVIRQEGEPAAKQLKKRFGTPYLFARPYGIEGTLEWIDKIAKISGLTLDNSFIKSEKEKSMIQISPAIYAFQHVIREHPDEARISLGGHRDVVKGILSYAEEELSLIRGNCWCDSEAMASEEIPYFSEDEWVQVISSEKKGLLMASGEALKWAKRNIDLQISNPDIKWRLNPYESPFIGFRGSVNLVNLWLNGLLDKINY